MTGPVADPVRYGGSVHDIRISMLGTLLIEVDGAIVTLSSPSQRVLIERLAIAEGNRASVDALADAIWGEDLPKDPANAVRYHIWQLRQAIGIPEVIETVPGGYRLAVAPGAIDLERFTAGMRSALASSNPEATIDLLDEAMSLWRGEALVDVIEREFAQTEIRRLTEMRRTALAVRARALVEAGRSTEAIPELEGLLEADPYDEASWSALMTALYQEGRQSDALRAYQRARKILGDDLGLEPSPELARLEERVLLHDSSLAPEAHTPTNLPTALTSFVGRSQEIERIADLLESRRLVSIVGTGGAGKTRLAIEAARQTLDRFSGGVWIADLTSVREGDDLFEAVGSRIGVPLTDQDRTSTSEVLSYLHRRAFLLILDNCEQILEAASIAAITILERCSQGRIVVTSRSALHVPGEVVFPIPVLQVPADGDSWEDTIATSAGDLLIQRATDAGAHVVPSPANAVIVAHLCRVLEGVPLAIELAAAKSRTVPLDVLAEQLDDTLSAYGEQRGTSDRHRTMDAMIAWSYDLLSPGEQALFRSLGVFVGGFTIDAAIRVCPTPHLSSSEVAGSIDALVEHSIVESSPDTGRYRLLEPLRLFALARLREADELDRLTKVHARAFSSIVSSAANEAHGPAHDMIRAGFRADASNIRAALEHLESTGETERMCEMVAALTAFWVAENRFDEQMRWGEACAPFVDDIDPDDAALISCLVAHSRVLSRDAEGGSEHMAAAITYARASGNDLVYADVISMFLSRNDALSFGEFFRPSDDVTLAEETVAIYEEHGDTHGLVDALVSLSNAKLWAFSGEADAVAIAVRARRLAEDIDYPDGVIWAMVREIAAMGNNNSGAPRDAAYLEALMDELLIVAPRATSPRSACEALITYAGYVFAQGNTDAAIESIEHSAAMADEAGQLYSAVLAYTTLALFLADAGRLGSIEALLVALDRAADRSVDRQTVWVVETAASFLAHAGEGELAARLIGAAEHQRSGGRNEMPPWDAERYEVTKATVRSATGPAYSDLVREGTGWNMGVAVQEAVRALSLISKGI